MTIDAHKQTARALKAAAQFLFFAIDHHWRSDDPEATPDQRRVRRGQAASDIAEATKHLALAAHWIAFGALETQPEEKRP